MSKSHDLAADDRPDSQDGTGESGESRETVRSPGGGGIVRRAFLSRGAMGVAGATALMRSTAPPEGEGAEGPDLHPWALVGCHALRLESWRGSPAGEGVDPEGPLPRTRAAAGPDRDGASPESELSSSAEELLSSVAPPSEVMLLPDSVDRWGRVLSSYRAAPLPGAGRRDGSLRWFGRGLGMADQLRDPGPRARRGEGAALTANRGRTLAGVTLDP